MSSSSSNAAAGGSSGGGGSSRKRRSSRGVTSSNSGGGGGGNNNQSSNGGGVGGVSGGGGFGGLPAALQQIDFSALTAQPILMAALAAAATAACSPNALQRPLFQQLPQLAPTHHRDGGSSSSTGGGGGNEKQRSSGSKSRASTVTTTTTTPTTINGGDDTIISPRTRSSNGIITTTSPTAPSSAHSTTTTSGSVWPPLCTSPSSQMTMHKIRKLKLYSVDEKIDIIDYAKVIGNRAAGREFNVAESSIREWRKNEDRLRKQSQNSANGPPRLAELISRLDDQLVDYVERDQNADWYSIRDKALDLWPTIAKGNETAESDMPITMGWVTRFFQRVDGRIRRIAPPVIATNAPTPTSGGGSTSGGGGGGSSVSMVCKSASSFLHGNGNGGGGNDHASSTASSTAASPDVSASTSPSPVAPLIAPLSRRKGQPRRAVDATLLLTPEKEKRVESSQLVVKSDNHQENDDNEPAEKRPKTGGDSKVDDASTRDENADKKEKLNGVIEVC